jgi:uncharacterized protein YdaU (DUF1376 family)
MNYYQFHIGDYKAHTSHLTFVEDIIYRRLLDLYYMSEQPLPDAERCARLIGMRDYIQDVSDVLSEFFLKSEGGYTSKRCETEIAGYRAKADRAKSANASRWSGSKTVLKSESVHIPTNNQEPLTSNQEPVVAEKPAPKARRKQQYPADFLPNETGLAAAAAKGIDAPRELEKFRDYHVSKGNVMADWQAAWRTWVGNARPAIAQQTYQKGATEPAWRKEQRERTQQAVPSISAKPAVEFFDVEAKNVTAISMG